MNPHTSPTPWRYYPSTDRQTIFDATGEPVARLLVRDRDGETLRANGALVRAAPEMHAALTKAAEQFDFTVRALALGQSVSISSLQNCAAQIRDVLAKL